MIRCFSNKAPEDNLLLLEPKESHHLVRVRRIRPGERIEVLNGQGQILEAQFEKTVGKKALLCVHKKNDIAPLTPKISLIQTLTKAKSFDLIVRAATELGIHEIYPVISTHSEVRLQAEQRQTKATHWKGIALEACKQSGNPWLPHINPITSLSTCIAKIANASANCVNLVADLRDASMPLIKFTNLPAKVKHIHLAIGPEGDFSTDELEQLKEHGFQSVSLGPNVLRAETAAIYGLSVLAAGRNRV